MKEGESGSSLSRNPVLQLNINPWITPQRRKRSYSGKGGESSLPKALLPKIVLVNRKLSWVSSGATSQDSSIMLGLPSVSMIERYVMLAASKEASSVATVTCMVGSSTVEYRCTTSKCFKIGDKIRARVDSRTKKSPGPGLGKNQCNIRHDTNKLRFDLPASIPELVVLYTVRVPKTRGASRRFNIGDIWIRASRNSERYCDNGYVSRIWRTRIRQPLNF